MSILTRFIAYAITFSVSICKKMKQQKTHTHNPLVNLPAEGGALCKSAILKTGLGDVMARGRWWVGFVCRVKYVYRGMCTGGVHI